jgi:hypothetical protein
MAKELRHALDPVAWAIEKLDFVPDPWQLSLPGDGDSIRGFSSPSLVVFDERQDNPDVHTAR